MDNAGITEAIVTPRSELVRKLHLLKQNPILAFTEHLKGEILYPENALRALGCRISGHRPDPT